MDISIHNVERKQALELTRSANEVTLWTKSPDGGYTSQYISIVYKVNDVKIIYFSESVSGTKDFRPYLDVMAIQYADKEVTTAL